MLRGDRLISNNHDDFYRACETRETDVYATAGAGNSASLHPEVLHQGGDAEDEPLPGADDGILSGV